jgi:hypothetical protein
MGCAKMCGQASLPLPTKTNLTHNPVAMLKHDSFWRITLGIGGE